jgi:Flp pilus assembly protein TadG
MGRIERILRNGRRRGSIAVFVTLGLMLLFAFAALAIDGARLHSLRNQVQVTADAAALAAAKKLPDASLSLQAAQETAVQNMDPANHGTVVDDADVVVGHWDFQTKTFTSGGTSLDAVRVTVRRSGVNANPVTLTLAKAFGWDDVDVEVTSIASFGTKDPWDVVVAQDVTASFVDEIAQARIADQAFLDCLVQHASPLSKFGIATFTGWGQIYAPVNSLVAGYSTFSNKITGLKTCGNAGFPICSGTDIAAGLEMAVAMFTAAGPSNGVPRAIVLVSDGEPNASSNGSHPTLNNTQLANLAVQWANTADSLDISVFVVFYNQTNDPAASAFLASLVRGEGIFLDTPDPNMLPSLMLQVCGSALPLKLVL